MPTTAYQVMEKDSGIFIPKREVFSDLQFAPMSTISKLLSDDLKWHKHQRSLYIVVSCFLFKSSGYMNHHCSDMAFSNQSLRQENTTFCYRETLEAEMVATANSFHMKLKFLLSNFSSRT